MNSYHDILIGELFPNPPLDDGKVFLACAGTIIKPVAVIVRTMEGDVVFQTVHCLPESGRTIEMDLSKLPPGKYDFSIISGTYRTHRSLRIEAPKRTWDWKGLFFRKSNIFRQKNTTPK